MIVGMIAGMVVSFALVARLGRHLLHIGIAIVAVGTVVLALTVTGARIASTLDLAPGLFLIGLGAGASMGQLFEFILAGVSMDEVGSASGVLEAVQQLSSAIGVAALGHDLLLGLRRPCRHTRSRSPPGPAWRRSRWRSCSSSGCRCTPAKSVEG